MPQNLRFNFDSRRTAQAACRVLLNQDGQMTLLQVIKLLYLVDREALAKRGNPVTGDRMVSMDHGPVLSGTYDLIKEKGDKSTLATWHKYVGHRQGRNLTAIPARPVADSDAERQLYDHLSAWELRLIDEICARYEGLSAGALIDHVHRLPEWEPPSGTSKPIDPTLILRDAGVAPERIAEIGHEAAEERRLLGILGAL
jgi:uncharacterized phage-associated protein